MSDAVLVADRLAHLEAIDPAVVESAADLDRFCGRRGGTDRSVRDLDLRE